MTHAEVIKAIADNKEVQYQSYFTDAWRDVNKDGLERWNPISRPDWLWRVKPEITPDYTSTHWLVADVWATVTWEGETGNPKSVEMAC
jgi:hypothetical protein